MRINRLFDFLTYQGENAPIEDTVAYKVAGEWKKFGTKEVIDIADQLSLGLMEMGIEKGDKVAIISFNRPEWNFVDLAIQQIGAVSVPMYPTITEEDYRYIFEDAGVKMAFAEDEYLYQKVSNAAEQVDSVSHLFTFDEVPGAAHWTQVMTHAKGQNYEALTAAKEQVKSDDLFTLIYTSGTTGKPKGVMLTHHNVLTNVIAMSKRLPEVQPRQRILSFLPLCHIFERTGFYYFMYESLSIYYAESMDTIADNLKEVKPMAFTTVPRLLEKVYDKIVAKGMELKGVKRSLFMWALNLGLKYEPNVKKGAWYNLQLKLANKLIFSKWREALGGNVSFIASAAAALQPRLARVFWAGQIRILEGYGLTETSPGVTFSLSNPEDIRIGTVGVPLEDVEIKIAEDGEILVKGPNVMQGYYNKPELTAEAIDKDGWFHTGDIGEFIEGRFLKITDRKKEMFKTSGGKYIAPQAIENKFKESIFIEQIMVVGEGEKFPAALIVPFEEGVREWCDHKGIIFHSMKEALNLPEVKEKFQREIARLNENFAKFEKIKKFEIVPEPWTIEGGELTPTLKLKRRNIKKKYEAIIKGFYQEEGSIA